MYVRYSMEGRCVHAQSSLLSFLLLATFLIMNAASADAQPVQFDMIDVRLHPGANLERGVLDFPVAMRARIQTARPLFSLPPERLREMRAEAELLTTRQVPDLTLWLRIKVEPGTNLEEFARQLMALPEVDVAEVVPPDSPPPSHDTPLFTDLQDYLGAAPVGIYAEAVWKITGGAGQGMTVYDIEYNWNRTHEDLSKAAGVTILMPTGHTQRDPFAANFQSENHGTAVLGELIADRDDKGVTGISWGANVGLAAQATFDSDNDPYNAHADAIILALNNGQVGDVILLETQTRVCGIEPPNPGSDLGYGPSEWHQSVFDATLFATISGRIVVAAAGNGSVDLDQDDCEDRFDRSVRDSGAIIVGAGATGGNDRRRLGFSSYGSRVDVQGWGENVMTTGYGTHWSDPDNPNDRNRWYRRNFAGTSSASPFVAGAATNIQGIRKAQGMAPLTSTQMRQLLADTGSPQLGNTAEHIGPRPNLLLAVATFTNVPPIADAGMDQLFIECTSFDGTVVTLDGSGSWDANDDVLTYTWLDGATVVAGPTNQAMVNVTLPLGTHDLTLRVSDGQYQDEDEVRIRVRDTTPPVITLVGDASMTLECGVDEYDEPGATVVDICDPNPSLVITGTVDLATPGTYQVFYNSSDASGNNAIQRIRTVEVEDTLPPEITIFSAPMSLFPPNHRYHTIALDRLDFSVEDFCDLTVTPDDVVLPVVSSDEAENATGDGDGNTYDDIVLSESCRAADVRAERMGRGDGRVYTLTLKVADASDNVGEADYQVHVPHNASVSPWAVDSGPMYVVERLECEPVAAELLASSSEEAGFSPVAGIGTEGMEAGRLVDVTEFALYQNHPNPLTGSASIVFELPQVSQVEIVLFDVRGREVARLVDESIEAGRHTVVLDAGELPTGTYIYRMTAGSFTASRTLTVIR